MVDNSRRTDVDSVSSPAFRSFRKEITGGIHTVKRHDCKGVRFLEERDWSLVENLNGSHVDELLMVLKKRAKEEAEV